MSLRNAGRILCLFALLALAACGFQPLYGSGSAPSKDARILLQQVKIELIPDKEGQILHNNLLDRINPRGRPRSPVYFLESDLSISTSSLGVSRDDTTTREKLTVSASFILKSKTDSVSFTIQRISGYSQTQSEYATLEAKNDAIRRSLREIANDASARVAAYLKSGQLG